LIDRINIENVLLQQCGVVFTTVHSSKSTIEIRPFDYPKTQGFSIVVSVEWRSVNAEVVFDNFAKPLLSAIIGSDELKIKLFSQQVNSAEKAGYKFKLLINNNKVLAPTFFNQTSIGQNVKISLSKGNLVPSDESREAIITEIIFSLMEILLSVLPHKTHSAYSEFTELGLPEGAVQKVYVNRYERSASNRKTCLNECGYQCNICGFDFEEKYGSLGKHYIHVHHLIPVSQLGDNYRINPVKDLIPVCPNCHAMLHKSSPPLSPNELKEQLINE
jgi:5-methylcytosine-specific restriction enzyme A